MKNKRKILLVSGIGIVIMAIAIGVTIAVSRPGTMKNSRQATSGQTTESKEKDNELPVLPIGTDTPQSGDDTSTTQSDSGTHGKKASREQAESNGKKNDSKSPDQKNTTGADSKAKADKKPSHSENQEPSDSKEDTTKQEDQPENPDRDQSNDGNGKDSGKKSSDTIELPFVPAEQEVAYEKQFKRTDKDTAWRQKEEYKTPQMEIIAFETEDIITASDGKQDDGVINLPFVPVGKQ